MKFFLAVLAVVALSNGSSAARVAPELREALQSGPQDIMIIVGESTTSTVLSQIESRSFANSVEKAEALVQSLQAVTSKRQAPILEAISKFSGFKAQGFYITDRISVKKATLELVEELAQRNDIELIRPAKVFHIETPVIEKEEVGGKMLEWGVDRVKAPAAWAAGYTGLGVVVSNIDTGVRASHEVLRDNYRGNTEYGWFDPDNRSNSSSDLNGHGSHTMGSIAGKTGTGVAPNATWVACLGCPAGTCPESALLGCGQWTACPTLFDGTGQDCSKKPHVSSNSWGGGSEDTFYNDVINSWLAVGIIPVFAMGNSGPGCRTANSPGDQPNVIGVGATTEQNTVASFSSHGPTAIELRIKPEVSAPGQGIRSCGFRADNLYATLSGTSMATPHVAGAVALLLEKKPDATLPQIAKALQDTAMRPPLQQVICDGGGVNVTYPWPNNSYGYGIIDVDQAIKSL